MDGGLVIGDRGNLLDGIMRRSWTDTRGNSMSSFLRFMSGCMHSIT